MYDSLLQYIKERSQSSLTNHDVDLIKEAFIPKRLRKRQFLLQEGETCKHIAFVVKGSTRQYRVDEKGHEQILNLCIENWWAGDRESFHKELPSIYNIDAWEETDFLLLPKANGYYDRVNDIPAFKEMRILLDDNHHMASQWRLLLSANYTADFRYEELSKRYPAFLQRFPQHIIASYLGVTKETLSRIRHQAVKK